jgi:hypothetical protein
MDTTEISSISDRKNSFPGICGFPPFGQKKAKGWGTELVQNHAVRDLDCYPATR